MLNVAIFEDEPLAVKKLKRLLAEVDASIEVVCTLSSNDEITAYLATQPKLDAIFSDIELTDGPVFSSFQLVMPKCPVVFITAYNQFMLDAFETSGVAYILKPYNKDKLAAAWQKCRMLSSREQARPEDNNPHVAISADMQQLLNVLSHQQTYPEKLAIKSSTSIYFLQIDSIVYIKADGGVISAFDRDNKRHFLSFSSLQKLDEQLNPKQFFRLNRSEYVNLKYIEKLERFAKNTISVYLQGTKTILTTSQSRTADFSKWLGI